MGGDQHGIDSHWPFPRIGRTFINRALLFKVFVRFDLMAFDQITAFFDIYGSRRRSLLHDHSDPHRDHVFQGRGRNAFTV